MTRPKVDDDKRQRTAQACDSCKRRKQKVCEELRHAITYWARELCGDASYAFRMMPHDELDLPSMRTFQIYRSADDLLITLRL